MDTLDELTQAIAAEVGIPVEAARQLAHEFHAAIQMSLEPGYRFVPLPELPCELTLQTAREAADIFLCSMPSYPENRFRNRGIVICGGTVRLFKCAWVCINMLRLVGCRLPVELWHLGASEFDARMKAFIEPLGVKCVDASEVRNRHPMRALRGWELKPFSMLHSSFEDVMLLDADNVPIMDPEFLFESPHFHETGALFWPNVEYSPADHKIWQLLQLDPCGEREFETGQIVLSKKRCWRALCLTMHFNEHSDFYYRFFHGDAETFHLAWRYAGHRFAMPSTPPERLSGTLCQHDFGGTRILQHRNGWKWDDPELRVGNFRYEDECRNFCKLLERQWTQTLCR